MKTLVLIRHAKSDWSDPNISDFDRSLNQKGLDDAPLIAREIHRLGINPDLIISSPAKRALTTARYFAEEFQYPFDKIQEEEIIYKGSSRDYINIISSASDEAECLLLVGHNPEISMTASILLSNFYEQFPTSTCLCIDFEIDEWIDIESEKGRIRFFLYPKNIR